ncbi:NACHT domain-containing protein [Streptomyces sp. NPDC091682]|uniref:NACHT domain-containing protein n=1 Tax=Streptomyces sp. NPDC091682 TaxID=3366005 RepID=UPI0038200972
MAYYAEPAAVALMRQATRLSQKVVVVERTARSSLLGPAATAADVPFTVRVTLLRGPGDPVTGTLNELVNAYAALPEGRLVITGAAGAGKTVLALELVLLLLERRRPEQPVPVRLSLAEWDPDTPLEHWLVRQISDTYSVRPRLAEALVAQRLILPVLDGLDEMDGEAGSSMRAARGLDQINRYHGPRGVAPLVVTCRPTTYERLSRDHGGLASAAVAKVEELDTEQVRCYLEQALAARSEGERRAWAEVIDNLHQLPAGALCTPWQLYLATTVYSGGRDPRDLLTLTAPGDIDRLLLERLIPVAVGTSPHPRYDAVRTKRWLTSFAVHAAHPNNNDRSGPAVDIMLHRLESVVGRKRVVALHGVVFFLVFSGLLPLTSPEDFSRLAWILGLALAGIGHSSEPIRLIRLRPRKHHAGEPFWDVMHRVDREGWKFQLKGSLSRQILPWVGWGALAILVGATLLHKLLFPSRSWGQAALVSPGMNALILVGYLLVAASAVAIQFIPTPIVEADTEPVLRPSAPLRQDALVSVLIISVVGSCALLWVEVAWILALAVLPYVVGRAWMRYLASIAVGVHRGMVPLRLAHFLAWAHRAGLLRTTGRTYQFRHRALQQWLLNEAQDREQIQHLNGRVRDRSLDDGERLTAARALVRLGTPDGTVALYHLATDRKAEFGARVQAMEALANVDELRGVAVRMLEAFSEMASTAKYTPVEFTTAIQALGHLDPDVTFELLQRISQSGKARHDAQEFASSIAQRVAKLTQATTESRLNVPVSGLVEAPANQVFAPIDSQQAVDRGEGARNPLTEASNVHLPEKGWDAAMLAALTRKYWSQPGE